MRGRNWGDADHSWEELQAQAPVSTITAKLVETISAQSPRRVNGHAAKPVSAEGVPIPLREPEPLDERIKRIPLAELIGEPLSSRKISCPFHEEDNTPSLHVYDDHFHCFGCGAHGDHFTWLRDVERLSYEAALELLLGWHGRIAQPRQKENDERTLKLALALWQAAQSIAGTPAIRYLAEVRGIDVEMLSADIPLRFHPR
jgi:hypothetical protein